MKRRVDRGSTDPTLGRAFLAAVHGLTKPPGDPEAAEAVDELVARFDVLLEQGGRMLQLLLVDGEARIGGIALELDSATFGMVADLTTVLGAVGVGGVTLTKGFRRAQWEAFAAELRDSIAAGANRFQKENHRDIVVHGGGGLRGPTATDPELVALQLLRALLEGAQGILLAREADQAPPVRPLRRLVQDVVDAVRLRGGVFEALTTVRDRGTPLDAPRLRAAVAIDVIGFGLHVGLGNRDLSTLAVAALLRGREAPTAYPGLGGEAMALTLCVRETAAARAGRDAGVPARMLAAAEVYRELTAGSTPRMAPFEALRRMVAGEIPGVAPEVARVFQDYKGAHPVGSSLDLSDGTAAVVVARGSASAGPGAPTVARWAPGSPPTDARLDLATSPGVRLTGPSKTLPGVPDLITVAPPAS